MCLRADVSLGELTEDCASRMFSWVGDPDVSESIGLSKEPTEERTLAWIRALRGNEGTLARTVLFNGKHVGNVVFDLLDQKARIARLSVYVGDKDARGKGIGSTAIYLALAQAFNEWQLHKVWLIVHVENVAAIRTYRGLGFQVEGKLRETFVVEHRRLDALYMGLLATEFSRLALDCSART